MLSQNELMATESTPSKDSQEGSRFYTTGEVAHYCGVNFRTVIRWIQRGELKAFRLPGRGDHRISTQDLLTFISTHQMQVPEALKQMQPSAISALVVDDDPPMAKSIGRLLRQFGFSVHYASDGFQAGMSLAHMKPALLTLDLKMPGLNGFEVLKLIRKDENLSHLKILVISGDQPSNLQKALKEGADETLEKPFERSHLIEKVKRLLPSLQFDKTV